MSFWSRFPEGRLLADVSLWSADMTALGDEVRRMAPYTDMFHIDVSDAHFVPGLLFFPDLVAALRPLTETPFHVHLMVESPLPLIDEFAGAGADAITVHWETGAVAPDALGRIARLGPAAGLALELGTTPEAARPFLDQLDLILLMGTPTGVKGVELAPEACDRIERMKRLLAEAGCEDKVRVEVDGGIREHTVPLLRAAGADLVVPGSLAFRSPDPATTFEWLRSLPR